MEEMPTIRLTRQDKICPTCGAYMIYSHTSERTIWTLNGPIHIIEYRYACNNPNCQNFRRSVRPEKQLAPPKKKYAYDVMVYITEKRMNNEKWDNIVKELREKGLSMTRQKAIEIYKYYLTLAADTLEKETLEKLKDKEINIAVDIIDPENGPAALLIVIETQTARPLHAAVLTSQSKDAIKNELETLKKKLEKANIKVKGIVSDNQEALVRAIEAVFPDAKHQLCQIHFIKNLAKPVIEADRKLAGALKREISNTGEYKKLNKKKKNPRSSSR